MAFIPQPCRKVRCYPGQVRAASRDDRDISQRQVRFVCFASCTDLLVFCFLSSLDQKLGSRSLLDRVRPSLALSLPAFCFVQLLAIMRFLSFVAASCALADVALAGADARHVRKITSPNMERRKRAARSVPRDVSTSNSAAETTYIIPQTAQTDKFKVNGSAIPNVDFDIGETYAGLLPISQDEGAGELYFWFHPSANEQADDEILIWLNGGPGCSSLEGLLQENGKFIWQYGTYKPVENPYNWANLTNIVWIEQPAGTGFSPRGNTPNATNEVEAAEQFLGFWKNFVDTFQLHNRKVFLTGESYAGQ